MKQQAPEILRERDVLGLEKPRNQLKPMKIKSGSGFLIITLVILIIMATVVYYLD